MDVFFEQYFDLDLMRDNFGEVLDGVLARRSSLSLVSAVLALDLGPVLALLRPRPARDAARARARDRLHRRLPGDPAAAGDPADLRQPAVPRTSCPSGCARPTFSASRTSSGTACCAITLTYGAYYAEVYRAGLEAVPYGQMEAARSLGMSHAQAMRHVIVPQAVRKVIPPMLNDFIALMKDTSLVEVIALVEVVKAGREVQAETFNSSALTLGALMFIVVTIPLARLVDRLIARQQAQLQRGPA